MLMVYAMLGVGFFFLSWAMTNLLIGLVATVAIPVVAQFTNDWNGFLVGIIIAGIAWGNLPLPADDHGHDDGHGHAPAANNFWNPWGIVYRALATAIGLTAITGFTLAISDPKTKLLWMERAQLAPLIPKIIPMGVAGLALLTVYVIVTNYGSAQAQG